jgi:uncharacterized protein involved in outer membrane biogenesis
VTSRKILADRRLHWAGGGFLALVALLLLIVAAFPWDMLRSTIERSLSDRFGRPVTIGRIERLDRLSFTPTIMIRDLRVPQATWAGAGNLATIKAARIRFPVLPLLVGRHFSPEAIDVSGMRLRLVRAKDGRENWARPGDRSDGGGPQTTLRGLRLTDSIVSYRDAKADRDFVAHLAADTRSGVRLEGTGHVQGAPVRLAARGPAVESAAGKPWPFQAQIEGPSLGMEVTGTMDAPLDTHRMTLDMTARADDLKLIDAVIEAGLFGTQKIRLQAHVRHDAPDWVVTTLSGTIGGSDITGHITVRKRGGRTKLDGAVVSKALAEERTTGPRLVPDTRINIRKIDRTDGTLRFEIRHLLAGRRRSSFTSMRGVLTMDHQLLTLSPLVMDMTRGRVDGSVRVDQRGGRMEPLVTIDLALRDSNVEALAGGGGTVDGRVDARARLTGTGSSFREAVGRSDGSIGLVAREGSLPAKLAALIGFDVGRRLLEGSDDRAALRCIVLRLDMHGGIGRVDPLIIDTSESQSRGEGSIRFPDESVAIRLTGAPKQHSLLRLPGSITMSGTIRSPDVAIAPGTKSLGNIFTAIGRAITGDQGPEATDADCDALAARALG